MQTEKRCELCERTGLKLQRHHLIPKTRHKNKKNKKMFSREDVKSRTAMLCRDCHRTVHATFSEKELEQHYNTLDLIASSPAIRDFIEWIQDHPGAGALKVKSGKSRSKLNRQKEIRLARK